MPIVSGGGGGGGPAAGSYLPVAGAGATLNTTTYNDTVSGVGKLTTLVLPINDAVLGVAVAGDAFPRWLLTADGTDGLYVYDGTDDPYNRGAFISGDSSGDLRFGTQKVGGVISIGKRVVLTTPPAANGDAVRVTDISPRFSITSGALSTVQLVTATGAQILTARDAETITPCTFNPGAATTATVTVELSPDNVTYSTLAVVTEPAGVALDGTILPVKVRVPAGWYLKLTVNAQAVLGLTTFY